jgi:hypothetical protein
LSKELDRGSEKEPERQLLVARPELPAILHEVKNFDRSRMLHVERQSRPTQSNEHYLAMAMRRSFLENKPIRLLGIKN